MDKELEILKIIADSSDDLIFAKDIDGIYIYSNKQDAFPLGKSDFDLFDKDMAQRLRASDLKMMEDKEARIFFSEIKDGPFAGNLQTKKYPMISDNGEVVGTFGIARDISEKVNEENDLTETAAKLKERMKELDCIYAISQIVEKTPSDIPVILQQVTNIIPEAWQNPETAFARIIYNDDKYEAGNACADGCSVKQSAEIKVGGIVSGSVNVCRLKTDDIIFLEEEQSLLNAIAERLGKIIERASAARELRRQRFKLEAAVRNRTFALQETNKLLQGEIQERKSVEKELRESEKRSRKAERVGRIGHWELDVVKNKLWWSDEVYRIFEIDKEKFGASYEAFLDVVHPDDREILANAFDQSLRDHSQYSITHRLLFDDGRIKYVDECSSTEYDIDGKPLRSIGTVRDITTQKRMEEQMRQLAKTDAIGQLAGGVAHDFNNLMQTILSGTENLILSGKLSGEAREFADSILETTQHAGRLTRQLLTFSRQEEEGFEELDLADLIKSVSSMLSRTINKNIALSAAFSEDDLHISGDKVLLEGVLLNMGINARDAIGEDGGNISFNCSKVSLDENILPQGYSHKQGDYIKISVTDDGCGIPEGIREKIFEALFTTKPEGKGTGIGLASAKKTVQAHDGFIDLQSTVGKGSSFNIFIPLSGTERVTKTEPRLIDEITRGSGGHILLIDDEVELSTSIARNINLLGYQTTVCNSGEDGISTFEHMKDEIDLILLDVIMTDIKGTEVFTRIKEKYPDTTIMFMSGYSGSDEQTNEIINKSAGLLHKPIALSVLSDAISHNIRK